MTESQNLPLPPGAFHVSNFSESSSLSTFLSVHPLPWMTQEEMQPRDISVDEKEIDRTQQWSPGVLHSTVL